MKILVKIGGTLLDTVESRTRLTREIVDLSRTGAEIVVVHGGGKQLSRFLSERNVENRFVNGMRVTTAEVMDAVLKVLGGTVNHELVAAFVAAGAHPVGLSGLDAATTIAEPLDAGLGAVGRPIGGNGCLLNLLTTNRYIPVVACIAGDAQGRIYNVNGDQMAAACAGAFGADSLYFLTDVEGVREADGSVLPSLTPSGIERLVATGVATGGMQAKLEAARQALGRPGVARIVIAPGHMHGIVGRLAAGELIGTRIAGEDAYL